ncbi:MAG: metallophosphoesterase family protein [Clostridium sp.]
MRFVIWGDSKGKENGINKKVLNSLMASISKLNPKPEFMVMLGDTVAGNIDEEVLIRQLFDLNDIINSHIPDIFLIPVIGNHEVNNIPLDDTYEKIISQFYYNLKPDGFLENYNKSVYYKDFENTRIIVLNSFHPGEIHRISDKQLNWLENTACKCDKNKLVFVHSPAYPTGAHIGHCLDLYPDARNKFWQSIEKSNIDIVFSGHEHNYSRRRINKYPSRDYIYQIITGGAGEKLRNKYKSRHGVIVPPKAVYHFLIADVEDKCMRVSAFAYNGKKIDEFKLDFS